MILGAVHYKADDRYAVFPAGYSQAGDDKAGLLVKLMVYNCYRIGIAYDAADDSQAVLHICLLYTSDAADD